MNTRISKQNAERYTWGNNCWSWVLNNTATLSVKQERMPAGAKEQLHVHRYASQFFFMLKGVATFYIDNNRVELKDQEGLTIENNQKHFVANEGSEPIEFLVISQPATLNDRIDL
jgi:mannose-6-phosphate isomerase-like protein (cupin superfamily)